MKLIQLNSTVRISRMASWARHPPPVRTCPFGPVPGDRHARFRPQERRRFAGCTAEKQRRIQSEQDRFDEQAKQKEQKPQAKAALPGARLRRRTSRCGRDETFRQGRDPRLLTKSLASNLIGKNTDMKRPAQPEELSPAHVFLAAPVCAGYITGIVLPVTGSVGAI
jgi:hypothetical protein